MNGGKGRQLSRHESYSRNAGRHCGGVLCTRLVVCASSSSRRRSTPSGAQQPPVRVTLIVALHPIPLRRVALVATALCVRFMGVCEWNNDYRYQHLARLLMPAPQNLTSRLEPKTADLTKANINVAAVKKTITISTRTSTSPKIIREKSKKFVEWSWSGEAVHAANLNDNFADYSQCIATSSPPVP